MTQLTPELHVMCWFGNEPCCKVSDAIAAIEAATEQGKRQPQWLPIADAPKDATAILVMRDIWPGTKSGRAKTCNAHNTYVAAWWQKENNQQGAWVCYMDAVLDPNCPIDPTHYMPLPLPPTPLQGKP